MSKKIKSKQLFTLFELQKKMIKIGNVKCYCITRNYFPFERINWLSLVIKRLTNDFYDDKLLAHLGPSLGLY